MNSVRIGMVVIVDDLFKGRLFLGFGFCGLWFGIVVG